MKKCQFCEHYSKHPMSPYSICHHPNNADIIHRNNYCEIERSDAGNCGPSGINYEAIKMGDKKSFWSRLFA